MLEATEATCIQSTRQLLLNTTNQEFRSSQRWTRVACIAREASDDECAV